MPDLGAICGKGSTSVMESLAPAPHGEVLYLDLPATTPVDSRVVDVMRPLLEAQFGNPHSDHAHGSAPAEAVALAAEQIADLLKADPGEIVFTSGATESNNAAIKGVMLSPDRRGDHIVVSAIEHKCVLEAARSLRAFGCEVTEVLPDPGGVVREEAVEAAMRPDTALVSLMLLNNEVGTLQPVAEVARMAHECGAVVHTDAAQAVGKIPVDVLDLGVDLLSLSGHKFYGPKGIGALYVSSACDVRLEPLIHGGGQQSGRRGGTVPAFLCAGLGEAARIVGEERHEVAADATAAAEIFDEALRGASPTVRRNGDPDAGTPFCRNYRFPKADADLMLRHLHGRLSASMGSACTAGAIEPSHVLTAMGLTGADATSSLRFGFGRGTDPIAARRAATLVAEAAQRSMTID
ncbi:MAG: cysteine desulfurase family protein [Pseudomonadota bacterium]